MSTIYKTITMFVFLSVVSVIGFSINIVYAEDYFVSTDGDDGSSGSIDAPFKTIQHAVNQVVEGDTIYVRGGTYEELVRVHDKGSNDGEWITIQPYQSELAVIDGANIEVTSSKRAGFSVRDSKKIHINGFEIKNVTTDSDDFYPAGIIVRGNSQSINIINNDVHHIKNTHIDGNAHGILVYGNDPQTIENIEIRDNEVHDLTLGSSESLTVNGNVSNFIVDNNAVYNNNNIGIDIAGHYGACVVEGCTDYARNGTVSNNRVENNSSAQNIAYNGDNSAAGIYVDGGANITVVNNYIANNNYGISIASENYGKVAKNVTITHNTVFANDKTGLIIGGSSKNNGGAHNIRVERNEFMMNDTLSTYKYEISVQHYVTESVFQGNVYYVSNVKQYMYIATNAEPDLQVGREKMRHYVQ